MKTQTLAFAAALLAHGLLAAEVRLGPEVPLSPRVEIGPAAYRQELPRVASNGHEFLAIWRDGRGGGPPAIYGARFDTKGHLIASLGKLVDEPVFPQVASAGGEYVLTWSEDGKQWIELLDASGSPAAAPFVVPGIEQALIYSNGSNYLLLSAKRSGAIPGMILDRHGNVQRVIQVPDTGLFPYVFSRDGQYLLFGQIGADVTLTTLTGSGDVLEVNRKLLTLLNGTTNTGIAIAPDRILIASGPPVAGFAIVGYDGSVIATRKNLEDASGSPLAAWDGHQFALFFSTIREPVAAIRITPEGVVRDRPSIFSSARDAQNPVTASNGSTELFLWTALDDIVGRAVEDFDELAATPDRSELVSMSGRAQIEVQTARAGDGRLLSVWVNDTDERIDGAVDGAPLTLSTIRAYHPAVAVGPRNFLVVWTQVTGSRFDVVAKRVGFNGSVLDPQPLLVSTQTAVPFYGVTDPDTTFGVAHDGNSSFLVTFGRIRLHGVRVRDDGTVIDAAPRTLTEAAGRSSRVLWTGAQFLVTYVLPNIGVPYLPLSAIAALRVDGGTAATTVPKVPLFLDPSANVLPFAVAQTVDRIALAWKSTPTPDPEQIVVGQGTLDGARPLTYPRAIATIACCLSAPAIGWNGSEVLVSWSESVAGKRRIRGMRFTRDLGIIDAEPFDVATDAVMNMPPSVAATPQGFVIAYSRSDDANGGAPRAMMRTLERLASPPQPPRRRATGH